MSGRLKPSLALGVLCAVPFVGSSLLAAPQLAERPQGLGNYEHLSTPRFVPAAQAHFMKSDDIVMGVSADGVAKAYQAPVAGWHHIIFDQLKSGPILVTWWTLCNTALVFRAEVDGKTLDFHESGCTGRGGLRGSNFTMRDSNTCSRWQQATGEAFEGPLKGNLDLFNALNTDAILTENSNFAVWRRPNSIPQARFARLSAQFDF